MSSCSSPVQEQGKRYRGAAQRGSVGIICQDSDMPYIHNADYDGDISFIPLNRFQNHENRLWLLELIEEMPKLEDI